MNEEKYFQVKKMNKNKRDIIAISIVSLFFAISIAQMTFQVGAQEEYTKPFFKINIMTPKGSVNRENVGYLLAEELLKIGIEVEYHIIDMSDWLSHAFAVPNTWDEGGYDMFLVQMGYGYDPNGMSGMFKTENWYPTGFNLYAYANPIVDQLLDDGVKETDSTRREEIYMEVGAILYDELPVIPYWRVINTFLLRDEVEGFEPIPEMGNMNNWEVPGRDYIKYVQSADADNLLPLFISSGISQRAVGFPCFDSLVTLDESNIPGPDLAESWEWVNETYIIFTLREDLKFHDGHPLTAEDVKFTFDAVMTEETASIHYSDTSDAIKDVFVLDTLEVAIELNTPFIPFLTQIAKEGILPKHIMEDIPYAEWKTCWMNTGINADGTPAQIIGSGPYKYIEWKKDEYIKLEAFEDHWKAPTTSEIYMVVIPDAATAYAALEAGEVDILNDWMGWTAEDINFANESPNLKTATYALPGPELVGINLGHPILANKWVRKAINYMIPREHIIDDLLGGGSRVAYQFLDEQTLGYNPDLEPIEYSVEKAKECMEKAGYLYEYITPKPSEPLPQWVWYTPVLTLVVGAVIGYAVLAMRKGT